MNRRSFLLTTAAFGLTAPNRAAAASAPLKEVRIGYQKTAVPLVVKAQKRLEQRFEPQGVSVNGSSSPSGRRCSKRVNAGAVDYGYTGDAPPIFAQAAHAAIRYVGVIPARGYGQAIVVPADSPVKLARRSARARRSASPRARARTICSSRRSRAPKIAGATSPRSISRPPTPPRAFSRGAIDAWSIWDPFFAIAELKQNARPLPIDPKATVQNSFFLANRDFLAEPRRRRRRDQRRGRQGDRLGRPSIATRSPAFSREASGVDLAAQKRSVDRAEFAFGAPRPTRSIAEQQAVADRFQRLGLIPAPIVVRDIVWVWQAQLLTHRHAKGLRHDEARKAARPLLVHPRQRRRLLSRHRQRQSRRPTSPISSRSPRRPTASASAAR